MEFPDLGKHCSLQSCKQLDFLPVVCDSCQETFCTDHMSYEAHKCRHSHLKDRRVPVCPLCNQPISISATDSLDAKVNEHIENYCRSDLAAEKRKTYTNSCSKKGCKQREVVPVVCDLCRRNFCLRHRHENDHDCAAKASQKGSIPNKRSSAAVMAGVAASSRKNTHAPAKVAAQRSLQQTANKSRNQTSTSRQAAAMSESEALSRAIQASLNDSSGNARQHSTSVAQGANLSQEEEDRVLAEVLAQSERDERERQRRQNNQQQSQSSCAMS